MTLRYENFIHRIKGDINDWWDVVDDLTSRYLNDTNYVYCQYHTQSITFNYHFDINTTNRLKLLGFEHTLFFEIPNIHFQGTGKSLRDLVNPLQTINGNTYLSFNDTLNVLSLLSIRSALKLSTHLSEMISVLPNDDSGNVNINKFLIAYYHEVINTLNKQLDDI